MQSEQIKNIVAKTNAILSGGDLGIESNEARNMMSSLLLSLCSHSQKNHFFAIAIYQHLVDQGFMMQNIRGEALMTFMDKFGKKMNSIDETQLASIRQISERLFSPTRI